MFLCKTNQGCFMENLFPARVYQEEQIDQPKRSLEIFSGRIIFYNGESRDIEIDLNFAIDKL